MALRACICFVSSLACSGQPRHNSSAEISCPCSESASQRNSNSASGSSDMAILLTGLVPMQRPVEPQTGSLPAALDRPQRGVQDLCRFTLAQPLVPQEAEDFPLLLRQSFHLGMELGPTLQG